MNETPHATPGGIQAWHQAALDDGRFLIQKDRAGNYLYYPREASPFDGSRPDWVDPKGTGTVYAVTTVRRKAEAGGDYNVSIIALDEGVRLMSRVEGLPPESIRIGLRVRARVLQIDGRGLVVFYPLDQRDQTAREST